MAFADEGRVDQHQGGVIVMNGHQIVTQAHHPGRIAEIQEVIDKLPAYLRLELRPCGQ